MTAIPENARRLVERCFAADAIAAAWPHVDADRVHVVKPPPWPVVARVAGHVVTVQHRLEGELLRGECTCEVAVDCAHAAATALVVLAREQEFRDAQVEAQRHTLVGEWLLELGKVEPEAAAPPTGNQTVAYVLDGRDGDVGLTVMASARLRGGGLAPGLPMAALGDPTRGPPRWVEVDDLRRIAMLRAVTRAMPQVVRLRVERIHPELIEELAGTGRLVWQRCDGPALAWGPRRAEALAWQAVDDPPGTFRLGLAPPAVIVTGRACLYVDPAAGTIGPLSPGVPDALVPRLVTSPPVPRAMRGAVARSLIPLWSGAAALDGAAEAIEAMRPRLVVRGGDGGGLRVEADALYGDAAFPLADWDPARPAARDLIAEGRARDRLAALLDHLPHALDARSNVALLANARHLAHAVVPVLRAEGWTCSFGEDVPVEPPREVTFVERLRPVGDASAWFGLALDVMIDGRTVPLLPILLAAIKSGELVIEPGGTLAERAGLHLRLPEGELVYVPGDRLGRWLRPLIELELSGTANGEVKVPALVAAELARGLDGGAMPPAVAAQLDAARERLDSLLALAPAEPPASFAGSLRGYQQVGLAWLRTLHDAGLGGLLADDMGLGKTVQVLAFLDGLRAAGALEAALVVAPRSVVGNWAREAARFTPALGTTIHLGAARPDEPAAVARTPVVLTSYQTLARDVEVLSAVPWTTVFFDEAQLVKNPDTQLRAAAASLAARSRFAVTGTPVENHLGELWSQLDLAIPGVLGRRRAFDAIYRKPIERHAAAHVLAHLRQRTRPFVLRREKREVERELPPKTEVVERIELDVAQRDLYESLRLSLDKDVRAALKEAALPGASMQILDALLKLRQCCGDPRLVKRPEAQRVGASAKLERLIGMLAELTDAGRATIVFSQWTSMLALIERACAAAGIATAKLTGATRDRDEVVARFQAGGAPVFLVSLKAGGVGLNLTRADTVIHYDPWWNPQVEAQATDRAHRIGQERPVLVYRLVARGTVEEAMLELQADKRRLFAATLAGGGVTQLGAGDLQALYRALVGEVPAADDAPAAAVAP